MEHFKSWVSLHPFLNSEEFKQIKLQINKDKSQLSPAYNDVGKIFSCIKEEEVRVIIIGDEPYTGLFKSNQKLQADGIWLSNEYAQDKLSPKLMEFYNWIARTYELNIDISDPPKTLNYLIEQGVLILSRDLTTCLHKSKAHYNLWSGFIRNFLKEFTGKNPDIPILLYGCEELESSIAHHKYYNIDLTQSTPNYNTSPLMKVNNHLRNSFNLAIKWHYSSWREYLENLRNTPDPQAQKILKLMDDTKLPF